MNKILQKQIEKTLEILRKRYVPIPLEIFDNDPYKSLIATLMSARTNDDTTVVAAQRLFKKAPDFASLTKLSEEEIAELIYPVGFYKTKAKNLKRLASMIKIVPETREELVKLPGVGRKTANLVLSRAFGVPAIAVDTHMHRITNMLGWVKTKTPEKTEIALMEVIPQKYWSDINRLIVSLGRQIRSIPKLKEFLQKEGLL